MKNVFHNKDEFTIVGPEWVERLKVIACEHPQRRARFCLHRSEDDPVQEMLIALHQTTLFRPHRHPSKTESFHIIDGRLIILLFQPDGSPMEFILLGPWLSGAQFSYRLCTPIFHAVLPVDKTVVYMENTTGPFRTDETEFAPWAPINDAELKSFLRNSALEVGVDESLLAF